MENLVHNGEGWMEELLQFRNWLADVREATRQHLPDHVASNMRFGPFLLRTRREILDRLLGVQKRLGIELVSGNEVARIRRLLEEEAKAEVGDGLEKFVLQLGNGKRLAVISDFDLLATSRRRLGPMHLNRAELVGRTVVSEEYWRLTRVAYHAV
jgi:hypothetical protein